MAEHKGKQPTNQETNTYKQTNNQTIKTRTRSALQALRASARTPSSSTLESLPRTCAFERPSKKDRDRDR
eukprot:2416963-Rhodomonas_salina.1